MVHSNDMGDFMLKKLIGTGSYGVEVHEVNWEEREVAVKIIPGNRLNEREVAILKGIPYHPNIIMFLGATVVKGHTYIFTDLATDESLFEHLYKRKAAVPTEQKLSWALQIAQGMHHLHSHRVVHRDLKSKNILITFGLVAKVCDFGTARILDETAMTEPKGTCGWTAPEIHMKKPISKKCDVFFIWNGPL